MKSLVLLLALTAVNQQGTTNDDDPPVIKPQETRSIEDFSDMEVQNEFTGALASLALLGWQKGAEEFEFNGKMIPREEYLDMLTRSLNAYGMQLGSRLSRRNMELTSVTKELAEERKNYQGTMVNIAFILSLFGIGLSIISAILTLNGIKTQRNLQRIMEQISSKTGGTS